MESKLTTLLKENKVKQLKSNMSSNIQLALKKMVGEIGKLEQVFSYNDIKSKLDILKIFMQVADNPE